MKIVLEKNQQDRMSENPTGAGGALCQSLVVARSSVSVVDLRPLGASAARRPGRRPDGRAVPRAIRARAPKTPRRISTKYTMTPEKEGITMAVKHIIKTNSGDPLAALATGSTHGAWHLAPGGDAAGLLQAGADLRARVREGRR